MCEGHWKKCPSLCLFCTVCVTPPVVLLEIDTAYIYLFEIISLICEAQWDGLK